MASGTVWDPMKTGGEHVAVATRTDIEILTTTRIPGPYDDTGYFERDITGVTANLAWDFGESTTLTSVTDFLTMEKSYREDTDGSPNPYFIFHTAQEFDQFSQEIRLNGSPSDDIHWTAGIYYLDIDHEGTLLDYELDLGSLFFGPGSLGDPDNFISGPTSNTATTKSWAVFGHVEYALTDGVNLTAALRYTDDERKVDFVSSDILGANVWGGNPGETLAIPFALADDPDAGLFDMNFDNYSAKLGLDWHVSDDTMWFVSLNRGHKAGSARVPAGGNPTLPLPTFPHDEEVLHSIEGGVKTTIADGKARLNITAFHYDYQDYQAFITVPNIIPAALSIVNLDAEATGAEVELFWTPSDRLSINLGAAAMSSQVPNVPLPSGRIIESELPYAPSLSLNGLVRYEWPAFNGSLAIQGDFNYSGDFCFTVLCAPLDQEDAYFIGNVRASYTDGDGRWELTAFANNIGDEHYRLYSLDISSLGIANDAFAAPRWYGATVSFYWD